MKSRNEFKNFFVKISLFMAGLLIVSAAIIAASLYLPKDENHYLFALLDKHELLKKTGGERIVFVGGSNLAFGIDSPKIELGTGKKVVNSSLHAALGMKYILQDVEPLLKSGDTVIVSPEYAQFYSEELFNGEILADTIVNVFPEGIRYLDYKQFINLAKNVPKITRNNILGVFKNALFKQASVYQRRNFNENGDMTGHLALKNKDRIGVEMLTGEIIEDVIAELNKFNGRVKRKNINCFFMYTSFNENSFAANKAAIEKLDAVLRSRLEFKILGTPADFVFDNKMFFDTGYHLDKTGREKRTDIIIGKLNEVRR